MSEIVEYLVIAFIGIGVLLGLLKGFVMVFFSWFSVFIGMVSSINFSYGVAHAFFPQYSSNIIVIFLIGIFLFSLVYIVIMKISQYCTAIFRQMNLAVLDHLLGGIFGGLQTMIFVGLAVYWMIVWGWVEMSSYPIAMFSVYWSEQIILLLGTQVDLANRLL
ncbi:MAG: CvpA family protein [Brevinema sp.]